MSDPKDVWPPPPSNPLAEPSLQPNDIRLGTASLCFFLASLILIIVLIVVLVDRVRGGISAGVSLVGQWLIGDLLLAFAGIALGVRNVRCWQGKVGLFGSVLVAVANMWPMLRQCVLGW